MKRGSCFEVFLNKRARWQWHERASNGEIVSVAEEYSTRYAAKRAAKRKAEVTRNATWRVVDH